MGLTDQDTETVTYHDPHSRVFIEKFKVITPQSTPRCLTKISTTVTVGRSSTDAAEAITKRILTDLETCLQPCKVSDSDWELAKQNFRSRIGKRIKSHCSDPQTRHTEPYTWHLVTCADDTQLSTYWYSHPAEQETCEDVGRRMILPFPVVEGAHSLGRNYSSKCYAPAEDKDEQDTLERENGATSDDGTVIDESEQEQEEEVGVPA
jgi:hypothetical protein